MFAELAMAALALPATVYGLGELRCGDVGAPRACAEGAVTASGEPFRPDAVAAAVFVPRQYRARVTQVWARVPGGPCVLLRVNDKGNERYVGKLGLDLTPGAFKALTGEEAKAHSRVEALQACGCGAFN